MIILIGSRAIPRGILNRDVNLSDIDLIIKNEVNYTELYDFLSKIGGPALKESPQHKGKYTGIVSCGNSYDRLEIDATENLSNSVLQEMFDTNELKYFTRKTILIGGQPIEVAVPKLEISYLIKKSHIKTPVHFEKNYGDYVRLSRHVNSSILELFMNDKLVRKFYDYRYDEAKKRFEDRQKRINFNVPNEKFFKKSENFRIFDHDNLHILIAENGVPVYTKCKRDPSKALINNDMYFDLSFKDQVRMVQEEATVIGIERFFLDTEDKEKILDKLTTVNGYDIYKKGLHKFICDLCKGDFQDHVLTREMTLALQLYNINWVPLLREAIEQEKLLTQ